MNRITFGTIMHMSKGKKPKKEAAEPQSGFLPYVDIQAFEKGIITSYANGENCLPCEDGNILIVCDGSRSGLVGFALKGYVASTLAIISADGMSPKYLYYFLQSLYPLLNTRKKGTGTPHLDQNVLKNAKVYLPLEDEQSRIVARIEELFSQLESGVETLKQTKAQLAIYRQAVLKEAFVGRFTNNQHIEVTAEIPCAESEMIKDLPVIPREWRYVSLSQLGDLGRGKSKHRPRNDAVLFENGKYPFIQTGEVKAANKANKPITEYSKKYSEFGLQQSKLWEKGTLCITIAANIAETAFLGIDACFPDSVVGFTANHITSAKYIKYFIESQKLKLWSFAPATAQKNINLDTLENLIVPYCDLSEQEMITNEIEARMTVCDQIEQTVDTALQQAEALRQSILKKAFEGGL